MSTRGLEGSAVTELFGDPREATRRAARRRLGVLLRLVSTLPVIAALVLICLLLADVLLGSVSWQVVKPRGSGQTFSWSQGFRPSHSWRRVVRLELAAQGRSEDEIKAFFADAEALRKFRARNRVELMWWANGKPFRWVVTNSRDKRLDDYGVLEGWRRSSELLASLGEGENLYLNPWFDTSFFARNASRTPLMAGLSNAILGSLWVILLVILFTLPLGVGSAVYLEEYAPDNSITRFTEVNLRNLAGVPSIVYGILGLSLFVRLAHFGPTILAAALTLSLLVLPVVVIASREAIRAVPNSLRQASFGLGATRWQTVRRVVLPSAVSGIMTGIILAIARAIGETAPLLLVGAAAFVPRPPKGPLSTYTVIPIQIFSWISENDAEFQHVAAAGILTLLIVLVLLYAVVDRVRRRYR